MTFFGSAGPTAAGKNIQYVMGSIVQSGAATQVVGGTLTASWDSDASCVLTYSPTFTANRVFAFATPTSGGNYTIQATGVGTTTAGFILKLSSATASGFGFNVLIMGQASL